MINLNFRFYVFTSEFNSGTNLDYLNPAAVSVPWVRETFLARFTVSIKSL